MWDNVPGRASGGDNEKYVVLQVVLTEKLFGTGSGVTSLTNLQTEINRQAAKGYRLHTISTTSSGSKGFLGGDKIQATMIFERID
jgi:phage protein